MKEHSDRAEGECDKEYWNASILGMIEYLQVLVLSNGILTVTHTNTHARTHACMHARAHTHTYFYIIIIIIIAALR